MPNSTVPANPVHPHRIVIRPRTGWVQVDFAELWRYRELLWTLASRELKAPYKQTVLGLLWAVLPPLLTMLVFNILFGVLLGKGGQPTLPGVPYAISTFCALVPWQFFANAVTKASTSLVINRGLITKVYFPRILAPTAMVLSVLLDFLIAFTLLILMVIGYHLFTDFTFRPDWRLLMLIPFTLLTFLTALAISLWSSALNAVYRDSQFIVRFGVQFLMYVTPVLYPAERILHGSTGWVAIIYGLNPMAGVVEGFRWALFGVSSSLSGLLMGISCAMVLLLLVGGLYYFRRMERVFADLV